MYKLIFAPSPRYEVDFFNNGYKYVKKVLTN